MTKARVFMNGRSQHVTVPAKYRFSTTEVFVEQDERSGAVTFSEKPLRPSMREVLANLREAGAADFVVERDLSLPEDRELF